MEEIMKELVRNSPVAAALLITMVIFLKALARRDDTLKEIHTGLKETLDTNSRVLSRVEKVLDKFNGKET